MQRTMVGKYAVNSANLSDDALLDQFLYFLNLVNVLKNN